MRRLESFSAAANNLLKRINGNAPGSYHTGSDWPLDELVEKLEADGIEIPVDTNPRDILAFAEEFYGHLPEPSPDPYGDHSSYSDHVFHSKSRDIDYVDRPPSAAPRGLSSKKSTKKNISQHDGYLAMHDDLDPFQDDEADVMDPEEFSHDRPGSPDGTDGGGGEGATGSFHDSAVDVAPEPLTSARAASQLELQGFDKLLREEGQNADSRVKREFVRPSIAVAQRFADMHHPRTETGKVMSWWSTRTGRHCFKTTGLWSCIFDPFREGTTSELAKLGVGVSLHFKFLKWAFWTFFVISMVTMPEMVINFNAGPKSGSKLGLDATSLGHLATVAFIFNGTTVSPNDNIPLITNSSSTVWDQGYSEAPVNLPLTKCGPSGEPCAYTRPELAKLYSALDIVAVTIFVLSLRWLQHFEKTEAAQVTKHHLTVDEYSIQCVKVPPDTDEEKIKKHFERLTGERVAEVALIQDNGRLLELYVKRGRIINALWKAAARVYLLRQTHRAGPQQHVITNKKMLMRRITEAVKRYDRLYAKFLQINEQRVKVKAGRKALGAFVTFETQKGFLKALDFYGPSAAPGLMGNRQPEALRLAPGMPLKVRQAPPPSTIIWENTHYTWKSRRFRRWLTTAGTAIVLCISLTANFFADRERKVFSSRLFADDCTLLVFSNDTSLVTPAYGEMAGNLTALASLFSDVDNGDKYATDLVSSDPRIAECYCSALTYSQAALAVLNVMDVCNSFWAAKAPLYIYTFFATAIIGAINVTIQYIFVGFGDFEKHHSVVTQELSIQRRVFIALFLNTGFVLLAVNAAFPGAAWVGSGVYSDFSPEWYGSVGTQITLAMIINIFTPHIFPLLGYYFFLQRRRTHIAYSQRELNELYLGPTFSLAFRVAQLQMTIYVVLLYSSGIPVLYVIACFSFGVQYYVDKYLLLNFYQIPPAYNERLLHWASSGMSWALIGHLGFAVWMLSARGIFWNGFSTGSSTATRIGADLGLTLDPNERAFYFAQRMTLDHIVPLYVLLIIIIGLKVAGFLFTGFDRIRSLCCRSVTCGIFDDGRIKRRYLNPDYSLAIDNDEIRGIPNYNLLENPKYMRALGITREFAQQHRHLYSVQDLEAADLPELTESTRSFRVPNNHASRKGQVEEEDEEEEEEEEEGGEDGEDGDDDGGEENREADAEAGERKSRKNDEEKKKKKKKKKQQMRGQGFGAAIGHAVAELNDLPPVFTGEDTGEPRDKRASIRNAFEHRGERDHFA